MLIIIADVLKPSLVMFRNSHRHVSVCYLRTRDGNVWALLSRRGLEFNDEFGGYAAAVFDVDALGSGPFADLGGIRPGRRWLAAAAGGAPGWAAGAAGGGNVAGQGVSERLSVPGV